MMENESSNGHNLSCVKATDTIIEPALLRSDSDNLTQ